MDIRETIFYQRHSGPTMGGSAMGSVLLLRALALSLPAALAAAVVPTISLSAGFTSDAVLQRSTEAGAKLYGFVASGSAPVSVTVSDSTGDTAQYTVHATVTPWVNTTGGCMPVQQPNGSMAGCTDPKTPAMPDHGQFTWVAVLKPQKAGGSNTITISTAGPNGTLTLERVTYGDVYYCSGQSNMVRLPLSLRALRALLLVSLTDLCPDTYSPRRSRRTTPSRPTASRPISLRGSTRSCGTSCSARWGTTSRRWKRSGLQPGTRWTRRCSARRTFATRASSGTT